MIFFLSLQTKTDPSSPSVIDLSQINFLQPWLEILRTYFNPFADTFFMGYNKSKFTSIKSYLLRVRPNEHDRVQPHDDQSAVVFSVALNEPRVDFAKGGIRFIRYNCTASDLRKGWALVFPSVITHYFENVDVSEGVRYTLISQIDA